MASSQEGGTKESSSLSSRIAMPLASSRSSSSKASKQRMSLPSTIDSSTKVTKSKAMKRRASLRHGSIKRDPSPARKSEDKENGGNTKMPRSPGPTPYWKVAEERGGNTSPRLTRSASKKKKQRLPPTMDNKSKNERRESGMVLNFSLPDQEANRRREKREMEESERERARRKEEARVTGELQIFSPNGTHSSWSGEKQDEPMEDATEGQICLQLSPKSDADGARTDSKPAAAAKNDQSNAGENEQVASELKHIRETMNKLLEAKANENETVSAELLLMEKKALDEQVLRNQQLANDNTKLESMNSKLQDQVKGWESKLSSEKESFLVEKTRLESEIGSSKREAQIQIQALEEARKQVADQLKTAQQDKAATTVRVAELENEVNLAREKTQQLKHTLETLRSESKRETDAMTVEAEELASANEQLSSELEQVMKVRDDLQNQVKEYEGALDSLENQLLPESEAQLKTALEKLCVQKEAAKQSEKDLKAKNDLIATMKAEIEALENEKEEERVQFQTLNEESSKAFEKVKLELSDKQDKIDAIAQQLTDVQNELADEQARSQDLQQQLESVKKDMDECIEELERSSQELETKLEQSGSEKAALEARLETAMNQVAALLDEKKNALAKCTTTSATLEEVQVALSEEKKSNEQLQNEGRDRQLRINELETSLKIALQERDDARSRMDTFDTREEDLFRKLRESDRIRRDLHARVMQLSGNIRVFVRVRPPLPGELEKQQTNHAVSKPKGSRKRKADEMIEDENPFKFPGLYDRSSPSTATKNHASSASSADDLTKNLIEVTEPFKDRGGLKDRRKKWRFGFDHVFSPEQDQNQVWEATEPLVQSAIDGYNVCIFAYGQTGSGKTYTMLGEPSNEGLISRSVAKLFEAKSEMEALSRGETRVKLSVELLEIYNENVRDLLAPKSSPSGSATNLKVTSNEVVGSKVVPTQTKDEVMAFLELAQKRRCVKATNSNAESSRSHMVFTIHFHVESKNGSARAGKLHICDLAGSERLNKSGANAVTGGSLLKETKCINSSLSVLSNVIERLQQSGGNVNVPIPYRESALTRILQNSLGGNSKTLAIVCCNPMSSSFNESLCSLRFAEKVSKVELKAVSSVQV